MKRKIIKIDEDLCNGCGICVDACHEGAIQMVDGKAKLVSESYCDGLGDCLPECPTGAITMEEREAEPYDEEAVKANIAAKEKAVEPLACGCPGTASRSISRPHSQHVEHSAPSGGIESELRQWPVQIKLVPVNAPYFNGAKLLIAADCTAYAYADIHRKFIKDRVTIIGCPKLDMLDYTDKLTAIISNNDIKSVTVLRMEVPCCGGIVTATKNALMGSGKYLPWNVITVTTDGQLIEA
ncbi:MAG: 4Fe-4S binding protein [Clostridia bacterium]|nr:4Fe-4S binding protein [Clostridia bacterium]